VQIKPIESGWSVDRPVRCIFCGAISAWWLCGCESAEKIREGKLARPRTVVRGGVAVIELCEELRRAARLAGVITGEYRKEGIADSRENTLGDSRRVAETAEISESASGTDSLKRGIGVSESSALVKADLANRRCDVCGKVFEPSRSTSRYCSDSCRARARRG